MITLEELVERVALLQDEVVTLKQLITSRPAGAATNGTTNGNGKYAKGSAAGDKLLLGPYGDPPVRFDPRDWTGQSYKGSKMSECPAEYLELLASAYDYFATKAEEDNKTYLSKTGEVKPAADSEWMSASKARGWAKKNREAEKHEAAEREALSALPDFSA